MRKRIMAIVIASVMIVTLVPALSFAESGESRQMVQQGQGAAAELGQSKDNDLDDQDLNIQDDLQKNDNNDNEGEQNTQEEQLPSQVSVTCKSNVKNTIGGTISGMPTGRNTAVITLEYGQSREFKIKANKGFSISSVMVNGVSMGKAETVTLTGNGESQSIIVKFKKKGLFIMLDAGHAGYYNRGIIRSYWESKMTWKLTKYLKKELESYGIVCGMTKKSQKHDPGVYQRGLMAKNYDLFISIHSNYSEASGTDYPLAIVSSKHKKKLYKKAQPLGKKLVKTIKKTMKTRQRYQVWIKRQSDGQDWYGVIRGAAAVNVPGIILEHSFHSNRSKCKWLMKKSNLKKMAAAEAKTIAKHYGYSKL